jgi:hydroxymethylglutaryl-CoA lyase
MAGESIEIVEVSPRDGIQNERTILSTEDKATLIGMARAAGLRRIEAVSFVNPRRVPQMADADAVAAALPDKAGLIGLVLNPRGLERAVAAGLPEINVVVVCTDTFARRNQGADTAALIDGARAVLAAAPEGMRVSVTLAAAFGCPFEGEVPVSRVVSVAERLLDAPGRPFDEVALADTIGVATPRDVAERLGALGGAPLRLHLHDTRGTGVANAWAGIEAGARALDAGLGGTGGCPFAPAATGNVATEDLVYMLERSGVSTGVDLDAAIRGAEWLEARLGTRAPSRVMRAGGFPAAA